MHPMFYLLPVFLAYLVFRSVKHYRAGRRQFFLLTLFLSCIIFYEILLQLYRHFIA